MVGSPLLAADEQLLTAIPSTLISYRHLMSQYELHEYIQQVCAMIHAGNKYMDEQAPWLLVKSTADTDKRRLYTVLYVITAYIRQLIVLLSPVIPHSCELLWKMYQFPIDLYTLNSLTIDIKDINISGIQIQTPVHIFPRIKA